MKKLAEKIVKNRQSINKVLIVLSILLLISSEISNILSGYMCNRIVFVVRIMVIINIGMIMFTEIRCKKKK